MGNVINKLNRVPIWYKLAALGVILIGVIATAHFSYWQPMDEEVKNLNIKLSGLERRLQDQKAVAENLSTFQENTKRLEEDLNQALTQLPKEKEIPALLRDIYTLGRKSGVGFSSFAPQAEKRQKLYAEIPIRLVLSGDYHEIAVFFDRIGKLSRIVNISELDLTSNVKEGDVELKVNCLLTTYMFVGGVN